MTAAEFGIVLLRLASQEFGPRDEQTIKHVLARAIETHGDELVDRNEQIDALLRAGALARLDTDVLVQELIRRGLDA